MTRAARFTGAWRFAAAGLVLCVLGAAVFGAVRMVYGVRPAYVHIRWAMPVSDEARPEIERRYRLSAGEEREGRTRGYYLTDLSRANIRAMVTDPAIEDTHYINRQAFRIWRTAPRAPYTGWGAPAAPLALDALAMLLLAAGSALVALAFIERRLPAPLRARLHAVSPWRWLHARIPEASAESVALFRIAFGSCLVAFFVLNPVSSEWVVSAARAPRLPGLVAPAMRVFEAAPSVADWLRPWLVFWGTLFVLGAMARVSFIMVTVGALAWALIYTSTVGAHAVSALMITLLCLVWSRWGDAWSIDAWQRRTPRAAAAIGREYGYTIWIPGFVLGVTLAAAAASKLRESGLAWILNGTVKYHFLSDSSQALVDWGLRLGTHYNLAVLFSFFAVAVEGLIVVGALSRSPRLRLATGVAAASLLAGFALFQGLVWPAWWLLVLSFLPWRAMTALLAKRPVSPLAFTSTAHPRLAAVQAALVLTIAAGQIVVSAARVEVDPLLSTYDMYSTTYSSPEDYTAKSGMSYWLVVQLADGTSESCRVDRRDVDGLSTESPDLASVTAVAADCLGRSVPLRSLTVEGRHREVDWDAWRFAGDVLRQPIGRPIVFESGR